MSFCYMRLDTFILLSAVWTSRRRIREGESREGNVSRLFSCHDFAMEILGEWGERNEVDEACLRG